MDKEKVDTTDGSPVPEEPTPGAPKPIDPETGQHEAYYVLNDEERAKGFVRPVRNAYIHVGLSRPKFKTRGLSEEEMRRFHGKGYVLFEEYPESESPKTGRYWSHAELGGGCGVETKTSGEIAETYAREPSFYGSTFCAGCKKHFPVEQFVWALDGERVGS